MFVGHLYVFFGQMSVSIFCPFFVWVVWFVDIELCELFIYFESQSLVGCIAVNIFSYSVGHLFVFVGSFLCCAELLSLIRSHLFIFVFIFSTSGDRSKKILL